MFKCVDLCMGKIAGVQVARRELGHDTDFCCWVTKVLCQCCVILNYKYLEKSNIYINNNDKFIVTTA
jgi:hypothetical protein